MGNEMISGAEALIRSLVQEKVKVVFGYPGGAIMPVYDKLYDCTRGDNKAFDHILVRHEQSAAHAAEGYARVSGEVGVCIVTSGPGATNTLTGVADAMMDSTPIVVIAGQVGISTLGTDAFQEVDLVGVTQPISKWSYQIRHAEDVAWAVSRAFFIARTGRPGPVVLDFPKNAQNEMVEWKPQNVDYIRSYVPFPKLNMDAVAEAAKLINEAERPLVLVGQGVELGNAQGELLEFLEKTGIPAGRTMLGLSALPSNHPLNMGMLGMHGSYAVNKKEQECDVLIAIGMRFSDRVTGNTATYAKQAKVIHLDIDRSEINKNVVADVAVIADCKQSLPAITRLVNKNSHDEWISSFRQYDEMERERVIRKAIHPESGPLLMGEVVNTVAETTKGQGVLVTDVGLNQLFACRYFKFGLNRSIVTSGGLGTMGFGLPAAIGATFKVKDRPVCLFTGDGSLQMSIQEFGTIMQYGCPVKIILLNNQYLGNVRQWQDLFFKGRRSYTFMENPDFSKVAEAYGIGYGLALDRSELKSLINEMLATPGPYLLECAVMPEENVMPMVCPGKSIDEMILE